MRRYLFIFLLFMLGAVYGQQNQLLYHMHYLGESNYLNPAVQSPCKWFIGIPVLSSVHLNYGNSAFSINQLTSADNTGTVNIDRVINQLGRRSIIGAELHTNILALGYKPSDYYFDFSIIEKVNIPLIIPRDVFGLLWNGNHTYEGRGRGFRGSSTYFNYYREFALGVSKKNSSDLYMGIKAKMLFGKMNLATPSSDIVLQTDPDSYALTFNGDFLANMSLPVDIVYDSGTIQDIIVDDPIDYMSLLLNRKNWGAAIDGGIIYPYSNRITLSASILDLGFIRWRSNLNNITGSGNFYYDGPMGDTLISPDYVEDLINSFSDSMQLEVTNSVYTTMLPVKTYLGINYEISPVLKAGGVFSTVIYKTKIATALTASIEYNPYRNVYLLASYSLMYRSFKNLGLGLSVGRGPLQFYMISDNALGFIWPYEMRNINLRFGLNINLGCSQKNNSSGSGSSYSSGGNCPVYSKYQERQRRKSNKKK